MDPSQPELVPTGSSDDAHNVSEFALRVFRAAYGPTVSAEDIFFYTYAVLSSPEAPREVRVIAVEDAPRIPLTKELADFKPLHSSRGIPRTPAPQL